MDQREVQEAANAIYAKLKGVRERDLQADTTSVIRKVSHSTHTRQSPVIRYVRSLGKEFRTAGEVAKVLGVSASYIRKLEQFTDTPSLSAPFGKFRIRIYTPEDIATLKEEIDRRMLTPGSQTSNIDSPPSNADPAEQ